MLVSIVYLDIDVPENYAVSNEVADLLVAAWNTLSANSQAEVVSSFLAANGDTFTVRWDAVRNIVPENALPTVAFSADDNAEGLNAPPPQTPAVPFEAPSRQH